MGYTSFGVFVSGLYLSTILGLTPGLISGNIFPVNMGVNFFSNNYISFFGEMLISEQSY